MVGEALSPGRAHGGGEGACGLGAEIAVDRERLGREGEDAVAIVDRLLQRRYFLVSGARLGAANGAPAWPLRCGSGRLVIAEQPADAVAEDRRRFVRSGVALGQAIEPALERRERDRLAQRLGRLLGRVVAHCAERLRPDPAVLRDPLRRAVREAGRSSPKLSGPGKPVEALLQRKPGVVRARGGGMMQQIIGEPLRQLGMRDGRRQLALHPGGNDPVLFQR
jgi:hypothetical protein